MFSRSPSELLRTLDAEQPTTTTAAATTPTAASEFERRPSGPAVLCGLIDVALVRRLAHVHGGGLGLGILPESGQLGREPGDAQVDGRGGRHADGGGVVVATTATTAAAGTAGGGGVGSTDRVVSCGLVLCFESVE